MFLKESAYFLRVVPVGEGVVSLPSFLICLLGTGKSVLLRSIIDVMRGKFRGDPLAVGVTASTGMAAVGIGGLTLHYFAGFTGAVGTQTLANVLKRVRSNPSARERWKKLKVLFIDEGMTDRFLHSLR